MYLGSQKDMVVGSTIIILIRASWTVQKRLPSGQSWAMTQSLILVSVHGALITSTLCILYSSVACVIVFYLRFKDLPTLTDSSISVLLLSSILAEGQVFTDPLSIFHVNTPHCVRSLMGPWKPDKVICISLIGNKLENSKSIGEKTRPRDFYFYILVYITGTGLGIESGILADKLQSVRL